MSPALREPFFLRGRNSPLQRAILMSLVLAGLSSAAAWIVTGAYCTAFWSPTAMRRVFGDWIGLPFALAMTSFAILIVGPLNHWRKREWLWTGPAVPLSFAMAIPFGILLAGGEHPLLNGKAPAAELATVLATFAVIPCFPLLPLLQRRWRDAGTLSLAILGSVVVGLLVVQLMRAGVLARFDIRNMTGSAFLKAGLISLWFAALSIPWGIPFWWPAAVAAASVEAD